MTLFAKLLTFSLALAGAGLALPAPAQEREALVRLINDYRASAPACARATPKPPAPLRLHQGLSNVRIQAGRFLDQALQRQGYAVASAEFISVSGAGDPQAAMETIALKYCDVLLNPKFADVGITRNGYVWTILLAQPAPPAVVSRLPAPLEAGRLILDAVNVARARGQLCGERYYPAAAPLAWNAQLAEAALGHSASMARERRLDHRDPQGRMVWERATQAGFGWSRVGENIAVGQDSVDTVVAGWLASPGHCANIMGRDYAEMGAAYALSDAFDPPRAYWTQVFGTQR